MIEIVLGNIGSGKTATTVRDIVKNEDGHLFYSNIHTPKLKHNIAITPEMIIKKEYDENGKLKSEKLNVQFWQQAVKEASKLHKPISVIIDEAHTLINSRRSQSKKSVIFTDFLALLRRVIGGASEGYGKLILISQLERRLDVIAREMATKIKFIVCHYVITCQKCKQKYVESNETPEKLGHCLSCGSSKLKRGAYIIEVYHFKNIDLFTRFNVFGEKTYHRHYTINDIEKYFSYYNTLQWDSLLSEI